MTKTFMVREVTLAYSGRKAESPMVMSAAAEVASFARPIIGNALVESVLVIAVNSRHRPQAWSLVATGTTTSCVVSPADILRFVVFTGNHGFFLVHNHPSGDTSPSADDALLTNRVNEAAKLLGLKLIDHVIVSEDDCYSFFAMGGIR